MHFILGVKPGDHAFLFEQVEAARREGRSPTLTRKEGKITCEVSWVWDVTLNESNPDLRVNCKRSVNATLGAGGILKACPTTKP